MARALNIHERGEEKVSLTDSAEFILDECRMVLPGIQALFGFQLIAVFNSGFKGELTAAEQRLHLLAIVMVVVATAMIMTPAAYHRQTGANRLTPRFIKLSTRLLLWSMFPLALGICLDVFLIARVVLSGGIAAAILAALLFAMIITLWFVLPRVRAMQRWLGAA